MPQQPAADDTRPRNAFGFLTGYAERDWQIGNCTPCWTKRHIYFLHRTNANGDKEYVETPTGKLRTWRTKEAAERYLCKLVK
jgi:hypothetical protein